MKPTVFLLAALLAGSILNSAQGEKYPEQIPMKLQMPEYWTPLPKVVTPGDIQTNNASISFRNIWLRPMQVQLFYLLS